MATRGTLSRSAGRTPVERVLGAPTTSQDRDRSWLQRVVQPAWEQMKQHMTLSRETETSIRMRLWRAGFPLGITAKDFLLLKRVGALFVAMLLLVVLAMFQQLTGLAIALEAYLLLACVGAVFGLIFPDLWLGSVTRRRIRSIHRALPDVIDLITVSVEAGLGIVAAIQEVCSRFRNPIGEEMMRVVSEMRLGRTFTQSMRDMAGRLDIDDLTAFVSQITQAEQFGVSIGNALRALSGMMRNRRQLRAEEQAQKAPVKMMIPLILFIFPTLFIVIAVPGAITAIDQLSGTALF